MLRWSTAVTFCFVCGCKQPVQPDPAVVVKIPLVHQHISEISIQHDRGDTDASIPDFTFIAKNDCSATYIGHGYANFNGTYHSTISAEQFLQMANLLESSHYTSFPEFYGLAATHLSWTRVTVVIDGQRKSVNDFGKLRQPGYGQEATEPLKHIEQVIDHVAMTTKWK